MGVPLWTLPKQILESRRDKLKDQLIAMEKRATESDPDGVMDDDTQNLFDKLQAALAELQAAITKRSAEDARDLASRGLQIGGGSTDHFRTAARGYRVATALAGACGLVVDDGRERELSQELQRRSGRNVEGLLIPFGAFQVPVERRTLSPAASGSGLIGTHLDDGGFVDALRAAIVCARLGAQYLVDLGQNTDLPRLSTTATAQWVLDGSGITQDVSQSFDKISLRPHLLGGIVEFTRNQLLTSTPAVQDAVRNDLVSVLARGIDLAAINGLGGVQPAGILAQATRLYSGTNGGPLTWSGILTLMETVQIGNAPETNLGFIGNPQIRAAAMNALKFPGVSGSMPIMDDPDKLAGYAYASTTQCPSNGTRGTGSGLSTLVYGAFSELLIAVFGEGVEVLVNPYGPTQFASGNVQCRALVSADVQLKHAASFAAIVDIAAP